MNSLAPTSFVVGLTGGMGCGKSTVGKCFEELGWTRIDLDQVVRDEVLLRADVVGAANTLFGPEVIDHEGKIIRSVLAEKVFSDANLLKRWEEVVHPAVFAELKRRLAQTSGLKCVVEVPLLFEKGLEKWFDFVVCVASSSSVQYVRLAERGISQALAEQRISKQLPLVKKIEHAHFVLSNDGTLVFLRDQVARLSAALMDRK